MRSMYFFILFLASFSVAAQDNNQFLFKDGNQVIRLEFEGNRSYLELNKPTLMKVHFENIDLANTAVVGRGISRKYSSVGEPFSLWTVTVDETSVVDGKYKVIVGYGKNEDGSNKRCTFFIPVKM